jgi:anti-anti-sigma factor
MSVEEALGPAEAAGPPPAEEDCEVRYHPHEVVTEIELRGALGLGTMLRVDRVLDQARDSGAQMVVVDLRELTFIDPAALRMFALADTLCLDRGIRLRVLSREQDCPEPVQRVLGSPGPPRFQRA